jgi:hypothetical protein
MRKTIIWNGAAHPATFHGTITVEAGDHASQELSPALARGEDVFLAGNIVTWGYVNYGTLRTGTQVSALGPESGAANGQTFIREHPWTLRVPLTKGRNRVGRIADSSGRLLYVELFAAAYDFRLLLLAAHDGHGGQGLVRILTTVNSYDAAGFGAPQFSVEASGDLVVTNPSFPNAGVTAFIDVMPLGLNRMAYLASAAQYGNT